MGSFDGLSGCLHCAREFKSTMRSASDDSANGSFDESQKAKPAGAGFGRSCLTMTYFRRDGPDYHRRWRVSRSCSRWEGVVPRRYGRQTLTRGQGSAAGIRVAIRGDTER